MSDKVLIIEAWDTCKNCGAETNGGVWNHDHLAKLEAVAEAARKLLLCPIGYWNEGDALLEALKSLDEETK